MEKINKSPRLAIVCPFINIPDYVIGMVDSIRTMEPYILILIDNNSNKETRKKLAYFKELENVIYIENDSNIGVASSWNMGCKIAFEQKTIEKVLIANNDILFHPYCIDAMVRIINNEKYALLSSFDVARDLDKPKDIFKYKNPLKPYEVDAPDFSNFMIKRETWEKIGAFDNKFYPAYFEDNDYHYRIRLQNKRGVKTTTALHYHYGSRTVHENPDVGSVSNAMYLQNEEYFVQKWGGKPGLEKHKTPFGK